MKRFSIMLFLFCFVLSGLAKADVNGKDVADKNAVYTFTAFAGSDTTATILTAGAGTDCAFEFTISGYKDTVFVKYETSLDGTNWIQAATPDTLTANGSTRKEISTMATMQNLRFIATSDSSFALTPKWKPGGFKF